MRIKLIIAYDGTAYAGWQLQRTGLGVQEKIEGALEAIFQKPVRVHSSSRTDTGVHALGMVAHFDLEKGSSNVPLPKIALALNSQLPPDIRVLRAASCPEDFHARFDATGKEYRYFVWNDRIANPLLRHCSWHVPQALDLAAMREAAGAFLGEHDFEALAVTRNYRPSSTVRTVTLCDFRRSGALLTFRVEADGFLYRMCRGIVGTLVQVGQGKFSPLDIGKILSGKKRDAAGMTAPAQGLVLWRVFYGGRKRGRGGRQ